MLTQNLKCFALAAIAPAFLLSSCLSSPKAIKPHSPAVKEITVNLLPLGDYPQDRLQQLEAELETSIGLEVEILGSVSIPPVTDSTRQQLDADAMMESLERSHGHQTSEKSIVLGILHKDLFISGIPEWRFAFSAWDDERMVGVISTFRMDPQTFGGVAQEALVTNRLSKMSKRYIAKMLLHHRDSLNPESLLYVSILGIDDLDRMRDQL